MAKSRKYAQARTKQAISPIMIGGVAIAAIAIVVGLIILGNQSRQITGSIDISQFPAEGDVDAPVTFIEFSDYG